MKGIKYLELTLKKTHELKLEESMTIFTPPEAVRYLNLILKNKDREHLALLTLDTKMNVTGYSIVYIGTNDQLNMSPFDIAKFAILTNSKNIIIGHNHPSGNAMPSRSDINSTKKLTKSLELLEIQLLDHIIIGDKKAYSITKESYIELGE